MYTVYGFGMIFESDLNVLLVGSVELRSWKKMLIFLFSQCRGGPSMSQFDEIQNISFLVPKDRKSVV